MHSIKFLIAYWACVSRKVTPESNFLLRNKIYETISEMSHKYIVLMIVMITSVALIQGASIASLLKCAHGFTYNDGCNSCSCDLTIPNWSCTERWCGDITLKPPPCLCK
ncbi:PREDICTED: uncharacterized protein LOC105450344 [Wasmannia auropunctata]|uniref:uncharacterized protein LOC105450344 n=1 Tax=Wasmannia auropunctata TaxID=64793 RepID=UPI0005EF604C|nr:PREDICTED: uncharacterized protein LOC105450344 [Wasmannia auropunctata]